MKKVLIWGTGKICRVFCEYLNESVQIVGFVETVPCKKIFNSCPVFQPSEITKQDYDILAVAIRYPDFVIENLIKKLNIDRNTVIFLYPHDLKDPKGYMANIGLLEGVVEQLYFVRLLKRQLKSVLFDKEFLKIFYSKVKLQGKTFEFMQTNDDIILQKINLPYVEQYIKYDYEIQKDMDCNLFYVMDYGKRIYFPEDWSRKKVICHYRDCCIDAHNQSPLHVSIGGKNNVYAEIGVQEGMNLLRNIEKVKRAYLVCQSEEWIPALSKTFERYQDRVCIVSKAEAISDRKLDIVNINTDNQADSCIAFFLENKEVRCYEVIVYYYPDMEQNIKKKLLDYGYECFDKGEVYYPYPLQHMKDLLPRKGLLTGRSNMENR